MRAVVDTSLVVAVLVLSVVAYIGNHHDCGTGYPHWMQIHCWGAE